jgi:hypothetical protein
VERDASLVGVVEVVVVVVKGLAVWVAAAEVGGDRVPSEQ